VTEAEALAKAERRSMTSRNDQLVVLRIDHPMIPEDYFYAIGADEKHLWTPDESTVAVYRDGERIS